MGMLLAMDQMNSHPLYNLIQRSFSIDRHIDLFLWMQDSVREYLPHDVLIATWGNFDSCKLNYDVVSSIPEVRTQKVIGARANVDNLMCKLYHRWVDNDEKWFVINHFDATENSRDGEECFLDKLIKMRSVLVYGIRDQRGRDDCLYVFFDSAEEFPIQHSVMGMLMPHIDSALRRVECLVNVPHTEEKPINSSLELLSEREQQILKWVKIGKTNYEIGLILEISPNTVKNHLKRIFGKLDVSSRVQAIAKLSDGEHVS